MSKNIKISVFPNATPERAYFAKQAETIEVSFEQLHNLVHDTAWSPAILKDNKRSSENFLECHVMALDFDGELPVRQAKQKLEDANLQYSLTYSKSHKLDKNGQGELDRFRVIVPLREPITDPKVFEATWLKLKSLFPGLDEQCKDPSRFYFASKICEDQDILNLNGALLEAEEPVVQKRQVKQTSGSEEKPGIKIIKQGALNFITNAHTGMPGSWSTALWVAAKELARGGFSKDVAYTLLESHCPEPFTDKDVKQFNSGFDKGSKEGPYNVLSKPNRREEFEAIYDFVDEELSNVFHVMEDDTGRRGLILEEKENHKVQQTSIERLATVIGQIVKENFGKLLNYKESLNYAENYVGYATTLKEEPKIVAFANDNCLAYHKLDFDLENIPTPLWDEVMSRTENSDAFQAFVWSLFEEEADRQQYVWLCGAGGNGKTTIAEEIVGRMLGNAFAPKRTAGASQNRFFAEGLIGKRFIVFSDTNNSTFARSEFLKETTGSDYIDVEPKGKSAYKAKIAVKYLFVSNHEPDISSKNADIRRLILCQIDPLPSGTEPDAHYKRKLWEERAGILYKCKQLYYKLTKNHGPIDCHSNFAHEAAEESEYAFSSIYKECLQKGTEEDFLSGDELYDIVRIAIKNRGVRLPDFKFWLENTMNIEKARKRVDNVHKRGYKGVKAK